MTAILSRDRLYRYYLRRDFCDDPAPMSALLFCMLNPSTADENLDDPTIRRCIGFAHREGVDSLIVCNVYALRATDPDQLWSVNDPVGPENDAYLPRCTSGVNQVICAWGRHAKHDRVEQVCRIFETHGCELLCLGQNKDGSPKHPLYIRADQPFVPFKRTSYTS